CPSDRIETIYKLGAGHNKEGSFSILRGGIWHNEYQEVFKGDFTANFRQFWKGCEVHAVQYQCKTRLPLAAIGALLYFWPALGLADTRYLLTDLGVLSRYQSYAYALNNQGQVVGSLYDNPDSLVSRAFLWTPSPTDRTLGAMEDLGSLGG